MTSLMLTAWHEMAAQAVVLSPPLSRRCLTKRTISRRKVASRSGACVCMHACICVCARVRVCGCAHVRGHVTLFLSLVRMYVRA